MDQLPCELVSTPEKQELGLFEIRDKNDYPVLYSAIAGNADIFITGDKDFEGAALKVAEILSPSAFLQKY